MPQTPWNDTTNITYYDADGNTLTSPENATSAEIVETVNGVEIRRTYLTRDNARPQWQPPGDVVGEPQAADFTKGTWDVYTFDNGIVRLAETLADLLSALGWDQLPEAEQRARVANLRKLPSWQAAPERLRNQADAWLG